MDRGSLCSGDELCAFSFWELRAFCLIPHGSILSCFEVERKVRIIAEENVLLGTEDSSRAFGLLFFLLGCVQSYDTWRWLVTSYIANCNCGTKTCLVKSFHFECESFKDEGMD